MSSFGQMLTTTSADYIYENQAITFIDNHDVTRFRYIQPNDKPFHAALAEARDALEDVVEPFLIQQGFIQRTPRGRLAAARAWDHLGLTPPQVGNGNPGGLFGK